MDWPLLQTHRALLGEQKVQGLLAVLRESILQHREALREAMGADDGTEVAHLAHRLAGSCDSLGFRALANGLRLLEEAARINDETAVHLIAPQIDEHCHRALETLEHLLQS
jgi:two-component system sensor histidine kinase TorS